MPDMCCTPCIVYKAEVQNEEKAFYIGETDGEFKKRYNNHTHSFRAEHKQNATRLSQYIWDKKLNPKPDIKWTILKKCKIYNPGHTFCDLCVSEKKIYSTSNNRPKECKQNKKQTWERSAYT